MFSIPLMVSEAFSILVIAAQIAALDPLMVTCASTIMVFLLLVLLLPHPLDVELLLLAPELRCTFPFELVPGDRELVLDGDLVLHKHPHGGEGQISFLQLHVLECRLLLVRPAHRPG